MKRQSSTLIFIGLSAAAALFAYAQVSAQEIITAQTTQMGTPLTRNDVFTMKFQKRFVHMTKRYKLTAEQQRQLKSILWKEQQDRQTVTADTYMSPGNKQDELLELHEVSQQKIGSILDKKQKHKFDFDEKNRAWMDGRLPEPNPGPPLGLY